MQQITIGDGITALEIDVKDSAGAPLPLTNCEVRVFLRGATSGDRPESASLEIPNCQLSSRDRTIRRASGSFVSDGVKVGMLAVANGIPEGAQVAEVAALAVTLDTRAIGSGAESVRFWFGLLAEIVDVPTGKVSIPAIATTLDPGDVSTEIYRGKVRVENTFTDDATWTDPSDGIVEFQAVRP